MKTIKIILCSWIYMQLLSGLTLQAQSSDRHDPAGPTPTDTVFEELIVKLATPPQGEFIPQNGYFASRTNDYFFWKGKKFLIDRSPIWSFSAYKDLYNDFQKKNSQITIGEHLAYGYAPVVQDKNYCIDWKLVNDSLFVGKILFENPNKDESPLSSEEKYARFENLVNDKFLQNSAAETEGRESPRGVIAASWVTDTLYIREALPTPAQNAIFSCSDDKWCEIEKQWDQSPLIELIFKDGVLVSSRQIEGKSYIDPVPLSSFSTETTELTDYKEQTYMRRKVRLFNVTYFDKMADDME